MLIIRLSSSKKNRVTNPLHVLPIQAWYTNSQNMSPDPYYTYDPKKPVVLGPCPRDTDLFRLPGEA